MAEERDGETHDVDEPDHSERQDGRHEKRSKGRYKDPADEEEQGEVK